MWWKICKLLVALVLIALLMLIFVNSKQQNTNADVEKKTKLAEEIQNNGRSELIESREMYLPIEDNENTKANAGKSIHTVSLLKPRLMRYNISGDENEEIRDNH